MNKKIHIDVIKPVYMFVLDDYCRIFEFLDAYGKSKNVGIIEEKNEQHYTAFELNQIFFN